MSNTSTIHIKTDFDCKVYVYGQELGVTKADTYFNIELRKGEHELTFVFTEDESISKTINYIVEDNDCDYKLYIELDDTICDALDSCIDDFYEGRLYVLPKDWKTLQASFKGGSAKLLYKLGYIYENEVYVYSLDKSGKIIGDDLKMKPEKRKALACYIEAAERGYAEAQYDLGCLNEGLPRDRWAGGDEMLSLVKINNSESVKWYTKAAEQGYVKAQIRLGKKLQANSGWDRSYSYNEALAKEALEWFTKAAEQGNLEAQYEIGCCYLVGIGVKEDGLKAVEWFTKAANKGYIAAQSHLGYCYENGYGVSKNLLEAIKWYKKAAEQGDTEDQYRLGCCFQHGTKEVIDLAKAVGWFTEAAEQGHSRAQYALARCYENGQGVEKSNSKAVDWYRRAAEQEFSDAQLALGNCYEYGKGVEKCLNKAVEWYTKAAISSGCRLTGSLYKCFFHQWSDYDILQAIDWYNMAAEKGIKEAQLILSVCYQEGYGVKKDLSKAKLWFDKAAEQGGGAWHYKNLGNRYQNGDGVIKDIQKAIECYTKAAELGDHWSQYLLGVFYYDGVCIKKDIVKAVEWFTKAAEERDGWLGVSDAKYYLGICYENGEGIAKDISKAVEWYTRAAEEGVKDAQFRLGLCCEFGKGVTKDLVKAIQWYTKVAYPNLDDDGNAIAQYHIGRFYEKGIGVEKNIAKAIEWYTMSSKQGNEEAQQALNRLKPNKTKPIKYLFFDTETTGIPEDYNAPVTDSSNWPHLVQLSWITTDEDCNILTKNDHIIYPKGFIIPADAARVHGITTSMAKKEGEPLEEILDEFEKDYDAAYFIVGHNVDFDKKVIRAELARLVKKDFILLSTKVTLCTMEASTDYCKIPGYHGYKWPSLQELHKKLFGCEFEDAHNSMSDVTATLKCFKEMRRIGLI